ncbi:hypothetical protein P7C70_g9637, partial [Phenoliferia sp. Uapishka_3]
MSSTSNSIPQVQATSTSTGPATPSSVSTSSVKRSEYTVGAIPAFKNYAAAASKSKPSPAAINGKVDVTATITPSAGSNLASPTPVAAPAVPAPSTMNAPPAAGSGHSRKESVKVEGVQVPLSRVNAIRGAAESNNVAFGNVNDKNAILSSSPANPPAVNGNGKPQAFGAVSTTANKAPINLHSFFGASPSQSPATLPGQAGAPSAGRPAFDARSPQPSSSPLPQT